MIKIIGILLCLAFFSPMAMADGTIGFVDVVSLFNKSTFVAKANKELQENVKKMEAKLQAAKEDLQKMINDYENAPTKKKSSLAKQITAAQASLAKMNQDYQQKVQEEQNSGLKTFTEMVQKAVAKIAKEKNINTVINNNAILYTDETWVDITNDVSAAMATN